MSDAGTRTAHAEEETNPARTGTAAPEEQGTSAAQGQEAGARTVTHGPPRPSDSSAAAPPSGPADASAPTGPSAGRPPAAFAAFTGRRGDRLSRLARAPRSFGRVLAVSATVFLLSSALTFGLGALSGANPAAAVLGETATPADIARMNHQFGLDRPLAVQYVSWLGHALTGDLGRSWFTTIPVAQSIAKAVPVDLSIAGLALLLAVLLGGSAGIAAARRPGSRLDRAVTAACTLLGTLPAFVVAIVMVTLFSLKLGLLPAGGYVPLDDDPLLWLRYTLMPAAALSLEAAAAIARQLRTSLVGALRENYVTGAAMRGLTSRRVLFGHALRNAAGPALTALGMSVPMLLGGAVVTQQIFALPGLAQLALQAAEQHDIPVIQGTLLVTITVVLVVNIAVNSLLLALSPAAARRGGAGRGERA